MKALLKNNPALVAGIGLPLILVLLFALAGHFTRVTVDNPQYDAVIATGYHTYAHNPYKIEIEDHKLAIEYEEQEDEARRPRPAPPQLFLFDHETLETRELDVDFKDIGEGKPLPEDVRKLNRRKLIDDAESPDGYRLTNNYRPGGFWPNIFGFGYKSRYRNALYKDGRYVDLNLPYTYYNVDLIGWVIDDE